jgi:BirA family biotin operon repressor/biotin-[acetyl-CoA-carboxylase] ligase
LIEIEKIMAQLQTSFIGREIHYFEKLSSTNTSAKQQARKGAKEGTTIIAETQTQGRGRLKRPWISPRGGIWLSVILRPATPVADVPKITLTAAVAVARTLRKMFGLKAEIKWPNDVLIDSKKVCGILTEATLKEKTVDFAIVGIGINANFPRDVLPKELQTAATTLKEALKRDIDQEKLVCILLKELEDRYKMFKEGRFEELLNEWRGMANFLGKEVEIASFGEKFRGVAVDIDEYGALIVKLANGTTRKILSGDVSLRKI